MKECSRAFRLPIEHLGGEHYHLCNLKLFVCVGNSQDRCLDWCLLTARLCIATRLTDKCVLRANIKVGERGSYRPAG